MSNITNCNQKPKPNINKIIQAARINTKNKSLCCPIFPYPKNCSVQRTNEFIEAEDGTHLCKFLCNRCVFTGWRCAVCENNSLCRDRESATRHKRRCHRLKKTKKIVVEINEGNDLKVEELHQQDNYFDNLASEIDALNFIEDVHREDVSIRGFMQYTHDKLVDKFLVPKSQDK